MVDTGGEEHGALVQQILETQKDLQDGNKIAKNVEIVSNTIGCIFIKHNWWINYTNLKIEF